MKRVSMSRRLIGVLALPAAALILGAQPATAKRSTPSAPIVEVAEGKPAAPSVSRA